MSCFKKWAVVVAMLLCTSAYSWECAVLATDKSGKDIVIYSSKKLLTNDPAEMLKYRDKAWSYLDFEDDSSYYMLFFIGDDFPAKYFQDGTRFAWMCSPLNKAFVVLNYYGDHCLIPADIVRELK